MTIIERGAGSGPVTPANDRWFTTVPADAGKRAFDLALAVLILMLASPILLLVALLVALDGGPVLFEHQRVGRAGRRFGCLKFRTMVPGASACLFEYLELHPEERERWERDVKLVRDPRVTPIGNMLRATSLDELPQLINVVRGEMSLVGPRPIAEGELARYGKAAPLYLSIRPGLTGPWQVSGRSDTSYDERVRLDAEYVTHRSFKGDLLLVAATGRAVLTRRGAR